MTSLAMRPAKRRANQHGFTLIELLVVIAIIALLAAILFPVFARARENGRKAACLSNLKQLGLGFTQYLQDYDNRFPGAGQVQEWQNGGHWVTGDTNALPGLTASDGKTPSGAKAIPDHANSALYPYVKNTQIFICPSNANGKITQLTYTMNCAVAGANDTSITSSSEVILLDDEAYNNDGFFYAVANTWSTDQMTKIHNGGGNLLFADGHAKFYQFNAFPVDRNAGTLKTRTSGAPRFYDPGLGHPDPTNSAHGYFDATTMGFGSCTAPDVP